MDAKRKARQAIYTAKKNAEKEKLASVKDSKENMFHVAKQMCTEGQDVIGEKCIQGDDGNLSLDDASKKLAWKQHEWLSNIEFLWSQSLPHVDPVAGPAQFITPDEVLKSLRHKKNGKAAGTSGVVAEMLRAAPDICYKIIADLISYVRERFLQIGVTASLLVFKGKGDVLDRIMF